MRLSDPWDGAWLVERRRALGLSQSELARRLGPTATQAQVSQWERTTRPTRPRPATRLRIAAALGEPIEDPPVDEEPVERVRLTRTRISAGLSQDSLAERLGVHRSVVSAWERGTRRPKPEALVRWRAALASNFSDNDRA